jgi:hypothetical protein
MSKRARFTIEVLVRVQLPAGVKAAAAVDFIKEQLASADTHSPHFATTPIIKLVKREVVYL